MASFVSKVKNTEPAHCSICREKKTVGRSLKDYRPTLGFVCDDCYKKYFGRIAHIEKKGFTVLYRPADIVQDEYRRNHIFVSVILFDMLKWCAAGGVMWLVFLGLYVMYGAGDLIPFAFIPTAIYALCSFLGGSRSLGELVKGLFEGMDHKRRLLLLAKMVTYMGLFALHGVLVYLWSSEVMMYLS